MLVFQVAKDREKKEKTKAETASPEPTKKNPIEAGAAFSTANKRIPLPDANYIFTPDFYNRTDQVTRGTRPDMKALVYAKVPVSREEGKSANLLVQLGQSRTSRWDGSYIVCTVGSSAPYNYSLDMISTSVAMVGAGQDFPSFKVLGLEIGAEYGFLFGAKYSALEILDSKILPSSTKFVPTSKFSSSLGYATAAFAAASVKPYGGAGFTIDGRLNFSNIGSGAAAQNFAGAEGGMGIGATFSGKHSVELSFAPKSSGGDYPNTEGMAFIKVKEKDLVPNLKASASVGITSSRRLATFGFSVSWEFANPF